MLQLRYFKVKNNMECFVMYSQVELFHMLNGFSDNDDEINKKNILKSIIDYPKFISPFAKDLLKKMLEINPMKRLL